MNSSREQPIPWRYLRELSHEMIEPAIGGNEEDVTIRHELHGFPFTDAVDDRSPWGEMVE